MDGGNESQSALYAVLLDRFHSLEASHERLKEQFNMLLQEKSNAQSNREDVVKNSFEVRMQDSGEMGEDSSWACVPGAYFSGSPYKNVLECMGHAVHVCRAVSGEIIYW